MLAKHIRLSGDYHMPPYLIHEVCDIHSHVNQMLKHTRFSD